MGNELSLSNVINVSLVPTASGLSEFNTANVLLLSTETPINAFEQNEEFRVYRGPTAVGNDFGVNSLTAQMANAIFSQTPNILTNSILTVCLLITELCIQNQTGLFGLLQWLKLMMNSERLSNLFGECIITPETVFP